MKASLSSSILECTPPLKDTHESTKQALQTIASINPQHPCVVVSLSDTASLFSHRISTSTEAVSQNSSGPTPLLSLAADFKPAPIARNNVSRLKTLTEFTNFPKLPKELRFKIYNLTLATQAVWISRSRKSHGRQVISMVCKEAKEEYQRQYKTLKKRASDIRPRFGPVFVNYRDDLVHFFHTSHDTESPSIDWALIMICKVERGFDIMNWLKPAQRVAIRLRSGNGDRGLCAPQTKHEVVWELFSRVCPAMEELVFIIADRDSSADDLVELKDFGGKVGVGEAELCRSFRSAQDKGFNVSAKLVIMGMPQAWAVCKGLLVEVVDLSV
ncbi:uncharacterized protein RCO7_00623 [Rhynchosporium graminicola]|uniref:2EXR domain-containing protein n=1 Tax=Rhynchosporium graminicola TaxID=2792576 RepID=A0A1E1KN02_9HELO|nr:uncharacterized protein RCO7_00623 [Rhynchosporium commune]